MLLCLQLKQSIAKNRCPKTKKNTCAAKQVRACTRAHAHTHTRHTRHTHAYTHTHAHTTHTRTHARTNVAIAALQCRLEGMPQRVSTEFERANCLEQARMGQNHANGRCVQTSQSRTIASTREAANANSQAMAGGAECFWAMMICEYRCYFSQLVPVPLP